MKRKGFTLIELLAVIVVLAIIALIATPIVMNVIKNANMGAAERSADNYVKAVDTLIATEKLDGNTIADGSYTITSTGKLTIDGKDYEVEVSGTKPVGGTIKIENGQVVKDESSIKVGDYTVTFVDGKAEAGEGKELMTLADCDLADGTANTIGAKYTCNLGDGDRVFYVLEAGTASKPATLILEGNYDTTKHPYCDPEGDNPEDAFQCLADGLAPKLDEIAEAWSELDRNQVGLPSMQQIMVADGQDEEAYEDYPCLSKKWLCYWDVESSEPTDGYWTSTTYVGVTAGAMNVSYNCCVDHDGFLYGGDKFGVRPVIMLSI